MNYTIKQVHITAINVGDVIEHNGKLMTVGLSDIKHGFLGMTIFGDSYKLGYKLVKRATIHAAKPAARSAAKAPADLVEALRKIASPTQTEGLLWWQLEARVALSRYEAAQQADK